MILQSYSWAYQENHNSKRPMHHNLHSSTVYNTQDVKTTYMYTTDEWIKMQSMHTMECYSAKEKNNAVRTQMDLERITLHEGSRTQTDKHHVKSLKCGI